MIIYLIAVFQFMTVKTVQLGCKSDILIQRIIQVVLEQVGIVYLIIIIFGLNALVFPITVSIILISTCTVGRVLS